MWFALAGVTGCRVFDPALYMDASAPADSGDNGPDSAPTLALGERCVGAPVVTSSMAAFAVDTTPLTSEYKDLTVCAGAELPGNDGFLAVDMQKGEKWHVHAATTDSTANPAIYILPESCEERACQRGMGIDNCGPGKPEHLTFFAPETRRYIIGIDSRNPGGAAYSLIVIKPTCGDMITEHSETCDDGNEVSGDGCDSRCRHELPLSGTAPEKEPNDDFLAANVLPVAAAGANGASATGTLAGRCDQDMFAVEVTAGGAIEAKLLTPAGLPCPASANGTLRIALVNPDGFTELLVGETKAGEGCPSIDTAVSLPMNFALGAGTYFLKVSANTDATVEYQVRASRR